MSFDFKVKTFLKGLQEKDPVYRNEVWLSAFNEEERNELILPAMHHNERNLKDHYEAILTSESSYRNDYDKLGRAFERFYMLDHVLVKVDRASMQYALEVRAPFLATDVVDFAHSLPARFKMSGFNRKAVLKKLMKGRLPEDIINRKKKGFGMPVAAWLNGPLKPLLEQYTDEAFIETQGLFNHAYIKKLITEHSSQKADHRKKLWTLLTFQLWWEKWMK
jgi:asparagine synthase (glutamine-hydrolysing)